MHSSAPIMNRLLRFAAVVLIATFLASCGSSSSTTPAPTVATLTGTVTVAGSGSPVAGATIKVLDGPNTGQSTTTSSTGKYALAGLTVGNANFSASLAPYDTVSTGVYVNGTNTLDFVFAVPSCQTNNTGQITFGNRS